MQGDQDEPMELKLHAGQRPKKNPLPLHYVGDEFTIKGQVFVLTKVRRTYITAGPKLPFELHTQEPKYRPELLNPTTEKGEPDGHSI